MYDKQHIDLYRLEVTDMFFDDLLPKKKRKKKKKWQSLLGDTKVPICVVQVQVLHISPLSSLLASVMHQVHTKDKYKYKGKYKYIPAHIAFIQASQQLFFLDGGVHHHFAHPRNCPSPLPRKESTFWAKVPKDLSVFYYMYVLTGDWTNKILFLSFFLGHLFLGSNYIR